MTGEDPKTVEGWHFCGEDLKLGYNDGRSIRAGETLTVEGTPVICSYGLHACEKALDALNYASGPIICRVRLSGTVIQGTGENVDKYAATSRTVLWMADATNVLHEFACWCAEKALRGERLASREPDPRSWAAIEMKRIWLRGEVTHKELYVTADAARAATLAAEMAATARAAAWAADRDEQNEKLEAMLNALEGEQDDQ